jgi:hypothetical protein
MQECWDEGTALSQVEQDFEKRGQKGHNVEWHYLGQQWYRRRDVGRADLLEKRSQSEKTRILMRNVRGPSTYRIPLR